MRQRLLCYFRPTESQDRLQVSSYGCWTQQFYFGQLIKCFAALRDGEGRSFLHKAALAGNAQLASLLITDSEIDVNGRSLAQETPLWLASVHGHRQVVKLLSRHHDIDMNLGSDCSTPLKAAIMEGRKEVVELLSKDDGVDVNPRSGDITPLYRAIHHGHKAMAEMLLVNRSLHADAPSPADAWMTPLKAAACKGYHDIARLLFERDDVDINRRTPPTNGAHYMLRPFTTRQE